MGSTGEAEAHKLLPPLPSPSSAPAAKEALGLAAYLLAMWSRHRDGLHALARRGHLTDEDKEVVDHLGGELKALGEMMMGEDNEEEEEEEGGWSSSSEGSREEEVDGDDEGEGMEVSKQGGGPSKL